MKLKYSDLQALLREVVIDASEKFANRRTADFMKKLQGLADDMPGVFARQQSQETELGAMMEDAKKIVDDNVNRKRFRLAVPGAFADDQFADETLLFDIIAINYERDPYYDDLRRFVQTNAEAFKRAASEIKSATVEIEKYADSLDWPAPWRRYTRWNSFLREVEDFNKGLDLLLR